MNNPVCTAPRDCGCTMWDYGKVNHVCAEMDCLNYEVPQSLTHADRIRAMSDEELVDKVICGHFIPNCPLRAPHCKDTDCSKCFLNWLRQPAKEDNDVHTTKTPQTE